MNAFAERFIGSVRKEAFYWFILFYEAQIEDILVEYIGDYNEKRPHQEIAQKVPKGYTPAKTREYYHLPNTFRFASSLRGFPTISGQKYLIVRSILRPDAIIHPHGTERPDCFSCILMIIHLILFITIGNPKYF